MDNTVCPASDTESRTPLAHQPETIIFDVIRYLIISEISLQEDIGEILTGLKIYLRLLLAFPFGGRDGKKNRFFAFNLDGNSHRVYPLP
jgi:hypothetical protein